MTGEVGEAGRHRRDILLAKVLFGDTAMHFQRPHGRHHDRSRRRQAGLAAFDVEKFLGPEIGAESRLGDHVIGQFEGGFGGHHRIAAMGDIGERPAVDEGRVVFQGLHQIGLHGVFQQHRHRPIGLQIGGPHRPPVAGLANHDIAQPARQILEPGGEVKKNRHHFGGDGDVEAGLARETIGYPAERTTTSRSARSFMSITRRQATRRPSRARSLPQ